MAAAARERFDRDASKFACSACCQRVRTPLSEALVCVECVGEKVCVTDAHVHRGAWIDGVCASQGQHLCLCGRAAPGCRPGVVVDVVHPPTCIRAFLPVGRQPRRARHDPRGLGTRIHTSTRIDTATRTSLRWLPVSCLRGVVDVVLSP